MSTNTARTFPAMLKDTHTICPVGGLALLGLVGFTGKMSLTRGDKTVSVNITGGTEWMLFAKGQTAVLDPILHGASKAAPISVTITVGE